MIDTNSKPVLHILNGIFGDITDRKGIGDELYCCDKDIQHEIYEGWRKIIIEGLEMFALENTAKNEKLRKQIEELRDCVGCEDCVSTDCLMNSK